MNFEEKAKKLAKELTMEYARKNKLFSQKSNVHSDMVDFHKLMNEYYQEILTMKNKFEDVL